MKRMKQILAGLLACAMCLGLVACGGSSSDSSSNSSSDSASSSSSDGSSSADSTAATSDEEMPTVVIYYLLAAIPEDQDMIQEAANEMTVEKLGIQVELNPIEYSSYQQQVNLVMAGSEQVDLVMVIGTDLSSYVSKGALIPLDDLLDTYGDGITAAIDEEYLSAGVINGEQYQIPCNRVMAQQYGIVMRADLVEKYNIDIDAIETEEDLNEVFETVSAGEPGMYMVNPQSSGSAMIVEDFDRLGDYFGVLEDMGQTLTVTNLFESESYANTLALHREWYLNGWISPDVLTSSDTPADMVAAGTLFSYFTPYKPGVETEVSNSCGVEMVATGLMEPLAYTSKVTGYGWGIMQNTANAEAAMQVLNLMYTDADFINLLDWGIEGVHYQQTDEENVITFADGVDSSTSGYFHNMTYLFGNSFLSYVWEGTDADVWEQTAEFNDNAVKSKALGFTFDASNVSTEYTAVTNVYDKYHVALTCGVVDPETTLPTFLEELEAAGLDVIIEEKQAQLDAWAEENGVS